jgi:hypothetical protein
MSRAAGPRVVHRAARTLWGTRDRPPARWSAAAAGLVQTGNGPAARAAASAVARHPRAGTGPAGRTGASFAPCCKGNTGDEREVSLRGLLGLGASALPVLQDPQP